MNIFAAIRRGSALKKVDMEEEKEKKQQHARKSLGGFGEIDLSYLRCFGDCAELFVW